MHLVVVAAVPFPTRQLGIQLMFDEPRRPIAQLVHLIEPIKLRPNHGSLQGTEREGFTRPIQQRPKPGRQSIRVQQQRSATASGDQFAAAEAERGQVFKRPRRSAEPRHLPPGVGATPIHSHVACAPAPGTPAKCLSAGAHPASALENIPLLDPIHRPLP